MTLQERKKHIAGMEGLLAKAKSEGRSLTEAEQGEFDMHENSITLGDTQTETQELERAAPRRPVGKLTPVGGAPAVHTTGERTFSLAKAMRVMVGDANVDAGFEKEVSQELARTRPREFRAPYGMLVPYSAFQRAADTTTTSPDSGHSLVGTDYRGDLIQRINSAIFRPPMASQLGITSISSDESTVVIPRMKTRLTASWIARDGTASAASDATFDSITMTPTTLALLFQMNRSIVYGTNPDAETLLMNDARIAIETALDDAVINGTGSSNQPLGFLGTGGATASSVYGSSTHVTSSNGFVAGYELRDELESYLKEANPSLRWLLHPKFIANLRQTPSFSGSLMPLVGPNDTQWAGRQFVEAAGYALPTPTGSPLATKGLLGDFSEMVACTFGPAIDLVVNGMADSVYSSGALLVRGLMDYAQATRDPKRVIVFNGDTI